MKDFILSIACTIGICTIIVCSVEYLRTRKYNKRLKKIKTELQQTHKDLNKVKLGIAMLKKII